MLDPRKIGRLEDRQECVSLVISLGRSKIRREIDFSETAFCSKREIHS